MRFSAAIRYRNTPDTPAPTIPATLCSGEETSLFLAPPLICFIVLSTLLIVVGLKPITEDLATTFSPVATTVNSECAPMERSLVGTRLTWHLVCKGQLDMELSGEFNFDSPHHYTGKVRTLATMTGMPPMDQQNTLEGQWVSACK